MRRDRENSYSITVTSTPRTTDRNNKQTPERTASVSANDRNHPVAAPPDTPEVRIPRYSLQHHQKTICDMM